jgi:hypothetical protein
VDPVIAAVTTTQGAFYIAGAAVELLGIALIASPDLVPGARRFSRWLAPRWRSIENRIRRLLHLRPRSITHSVEVAGTIETAGSLSAVTSVAADADLEQKVEFLLRRDREEQQEINTLSERFESLERESARRLDELREQMEEHVSSELSSALADYRPVRIVGAVAVAAGLGLATAGNFLG